MLPGLLAPVVMLTAALSGGAFLLRQEARRRRVNRQLEVATLGLHDPTEKPQRRRIRLENVPDEQQRSLAYKLLRYDPEASFSSPASRTVIAGIVVAIVVLLLGRMLLPFWLAPIAGTMAGLMVIRGLFGRQRDRYADRLLRQLPDTVQMVVGAVRAGMPVGEAFRIIAREMQEPTRGEFGRVVDELALGRPAEEALFNIYRRTRVQEYAMFSVTLSVQTKSGGHLAETIEILGDAIRERIAIAGRAKALAAEAKLSAQVLGALPFIMAALLSVMHPGYLTPLLQDPRGRIMLAYAVTSLLCGVLAMRSMIKKGTAV